VPLAPIPTFRFPESAAVALARVTTYGQWLARPASEVPCLSGFDRAAVRAVVARQVASGASWLSPGATEELLKAGGIPTAEARFARSADQAAAAAAAIGFPVVLKAAGESIVHKTEIGGVKLGIDSEQRARAVYADFAARLGTTLEGVLVQKMVPAGVEMVVGAINDAAFGPLVMAGTGGIFVELVGDTVFRLCPLTDSDAEEMVEEMKGRVLLRGYRGSAPADERAFREVLLRVSQLAAACPEIQEMDLNPVLVLGTGAVAVDARIRVGRKAPRGAGRRISY
jgi:acyl-CoA synthetase (NDP forming)